MRKSAEDLKRLEQIHNMPCICCELEDEIRGREIPQPNRTTAHHLVDMGTRELSGGDQATIPACEWHHLGRKKAGFDVVDMVAKWGPSLALTKKAFIQRYGRERYLLQLTNDLIGVE